MTFAELEYDSKKRRTRREIFLEKMEGLIPWQQLEDRIEPFYAKAGRGRRPYPLGVMLRVHCVQLFYNLSDPGMEDLLYEVESVRRFAGLRLSGPLPDETTILNFRHLLETQGLGMGLFEEINVHLASLGHRLKTGTIVDASTRPRTSSSGFPFGLHSRPGFLKSLTSSFFFVSTEIAGAWRRSCDHTRRSMYRNWLSRSTCCSPSRVFRFACRL